MKKLTLIALMALVMLGFTQCKKETPAESNLVDITFTATRGDAKTSISPLGAVEFVAGDKIHVYGATTGYRGYLEFVSGAKGEAATFSGSITQWNDNETLRFVYMGSYNDNRMGSDGSLMVNFDDQTYEGVQSPENDLANIAQKFHISRYVQASVPASTTEFSGVMENVMALAAFNTSAFNDGSNVKIIGTHPDGAAANLFKTRLQITAKGAYNYYVAGMSSNSGSYQSGSITTGPGQEKRFVALLPRGFDNDNTLDLMFTSNDMVSTSDLNVTIHRNTFLYEGDFDGITIAAMPVSTENYVNLAFASNATFSVSPTKTVKFSKGNLVYDQGRFKMHKEQYARCFTDKYWSSQTHPNLKDLMRVYTSFDYFRWATSGWNNGNTNYAPYCIAHSSQAANYGPKVNGNYISLYESDGNKADWGTYQFGMNASNISWRTLTSDEWGWLIGPPSGNASPGNNCRESSTVNHVQNARYAKAIVNGTNGMFIFPDRYEHPRNVTPIVGINDEGNHWNNDDPAENNVYDLTAWDAMERAGMIFLPAGGDCIYYYGNTGNGDYGKYWSSTFNNGTRGYCSLFCSNKATGYHYVYPQDNNGQFQYGLSVRLVCDAN